MGWLSMTRAHMGTHKSPKSYLDAQFRFSGTDAQGRAYEHVVFASGMYGTTEYYAAVMRSQADKPPVIFAVACMTFWSPRAKDGFIFGYKDMDETMGPNIDNCPPHVLCWLSATDNEPALRWRARCQAKADKPKLCDRDVVEFGSPIRFTDGFVGARFTVAKHKNHIRFMPPDSRSWYQIGKLRERDYTVIARRA